MTDAELRAAVDALKRFPWIPQHELSRVSGGREYDGGRLEDAEEMLADDGWEFDHFIGGWVQGRKVA